MAREKGQTYIAKQKSKIVLELLKEEETIYQLGTEFNITANTIYSAHKFLI